MAAPSMSLASRIAERGYESDEESVASQGASLSPFSFLQSCQLLLTVIRSGFLQALVYLKLNLTDIKARKGTYCLGLMSCTIVVFVTALMITVLARLPVLFMRLAEINEGEIDLLLTPGGQASAATSLNYSMVLADQATFGSGPYSYHTPRMTLDASVASVAIWPLSSCRNASGSPVNISEGLAFLWQPNVAGVHSASSLAAAEAACPTQLGCPDQYCFANLTVVPSVYGIDFAQEAAIGLGRSWTTPSPGIGGCILHVDLAARIGISVGDYVLLQADISYSMLQPFINAELDDWFSSPYTTWGRVLVPLRVTALESSGHGKFPNSLNDFLLIDYGLMLQTFAPYLNPAIDAYKRTLFADTDPNGSANQIIFNIPPAERLSIYSQSSTQAILTSVTSFASPIIAVLGFNQLSVDTPISDYIQSNSFFSLFLGLILSLMILGLSFLSMVLIYSLLTVGVETRTFELGIMRMVGMTRTMLVGHVVMGAMLFSVPAWAMGIVLAQLGFLITVGELQSSLGVSLSGLLTADAIGFATLVGFGMPLLSSIAPILHVLAMSLPKALDINRSRTETILYDISRGAEYKVNMTVVGLGIFMAVAGFLVYYLFPVALVTLNITLLFYIFFGLLIGMLFGLVLLASSFQGLLETVVIYCLLFWESPAVFQLIRKNLTAHRLRNKKTALMFSTSIGFLVFLSVTFTIEIESLVYSAQSSYGGQLYASSATDLSYFTVTVMDAALREIVDNPDAVIAGGPVPGLRWTWESAELISQPNVNNVSVFNVGRYLTYTPTFVSVAPNFWEAANRNYLIPRYIRPSSWDLGTSLYSFDGSARCVLSTSYEENLALQGVDAPFVVDVLVQSGNSSVNYIRLAQSDAWLDASPVVIFSKYTTSGNTVVSSLPAMMNRAQGVIPSVEMMLFARFVIAMDNDADVGRVETAINTALTNNYVNGITDIHNLLSVTDSLQVAVNIVNLFFTFAEVMALFICFFALNASMSTNIHEQAKEIGILRSIGLGKTPLTRIYIWEAFTLVLAAGLLGTIVGVLVGYTIVLQQSLFTQLPLPFVFPYEQLAAIIVLSFVFAFLASFAPVRALLRGRSITSILRRAI